MISLSTIASERMAPGTLASLRTDKEQTANAVRLACVGLGVAVRVWADGPSGATLTIAEPDERMARYEARPYEHPRRQLAWLIRDLRAMGFRCRDADGVVVVRATMPGK